MIPSPRSSRISTALALSGSLLLAASCGGDKTSPSATTATATAPPAPATSSSSETTGTASEAPTASATAADDAGAPPPAKDADYDPLNKAKPQTDSEELQARARGLFEAIVQNNPALGEDFWFPKEPFLVLKDIKDPGKYWDQLHRAYAKDIQKLHDKRKSWDGAEFVKFEPGSAPKWVKPGEEANKIGYYRTVKGNLVFKDKADGKPQKLEVRVIISWQKRWYITHLSKFK